MTNENDELRDRSGSVDATDPFVCFLYILMRDHLPLGVVEEIYRDHVAGSTTHEYTNGYLAGYAKDLAERMREEK